MSLKDFISVKKVEYTKKLINAEKLSDIEKEKNFSLGKELTQYILEYGYLAYRYIELYGINSKQMIDSDMVKQTEYLHKYFPKTIGYIALENTGDGNYMIVSSKDEVFEFCSEEDSIKNTDLTLFDYILKRFQEVDM